MRGLIYNTNIDGEDTTDGSYDFSNAQRYIGMILDKDSGFNTDDLSEEDTAHFNTLLTTLTRIGFVIPEKEKLMVSGIEEQLKIMATIFDLFLNVMPNYFSDAISDKDVEDLYREASNRNKAQVEFLRMQPLGAIKSFLKIS